MLVRDVMTASPICCDPADTLMEARQVRRLPVVDDEQRVVGVVAPSDLAPIFASTNVADFLLAVSYWSRKGSVAVPPDQSMNVNIAITAIPAEISAV